MPLASPKKYPISVSSQEQMRRAGLNLSLCRRVRGWTQMEMATHCSMGVSTLVAIEKGATHVSMVHWIQALETLGLQGGLSGLADISQDEEAMRKMMELVPKRAKASLRRAR